MTLLVAVILTLNEEEHLADCLDSLRDLTSNVMVLDSGSADRTLDIASQHGADVQHSRFDGYASQRNVALDRCAEASWILFLDADERLTSASRQEIRESVATAGDDVAVFWLPRKNVAFGRTLQGGGWWPDYQARLIRHGRGRFDTSREVHEVLRVDGASVLLCEPFIHHNYASRREFMQKQRAYTLRSVQQESVQVPRRRAYLGRPVREFWRRFVTLHGYRDGATGVFMAAVMALEEFRACLLLRRRASS